MRAASGESLGLRFFQPQTGTVMEARDLEKMRLNPVDEAEDDGPMDPDDASQALARVAQIFDAQEDRGEHPKDETADRIDAT